MSVLSEQSEDEPPRGKPSAAAGGSRPTVVTEHAAVNRIRRLSKLSAEYSQIRKADEEQYHKLRTLAMRERRPPGLGTATPSKKKKFHLMTEEERKQRIKQLWDLFRTGVWVTVFTNQLKKRAQMDHLVLYATPPLPENFDANDYRMEDKKPNKTVKNLWSWAEILFETALAIPVAFMLFLSPLSLAFSGVVSFYDFDRPSGQVVIFIEVCWVLEIVTCFFRMPPHTKKSPFLERQYINWVRRRSLMPYPSPNESKYRTIARRYLCTFFLIDVLTVIPPLLIRLQSGEEVSEGRLFWIDGFHMLRIFRLGQIISPLRLGLLRWYKKERGLKTAIIQGTWALIVCSMLIHFAACGWIYAGRLHNDEDSGRVSWMYQESTDGDYFRNVENKSI